MIRVPVIAYEDVTQDAFVATARAFIRRDEPRFALWQVVYREGFSGQMHPAVVVGLTPRDGDWFYDVIFPDATGRPRREAVAEASLRSKAA